MARTSTKTLRRKRSSSRSRTLSRSKQKKARGGGKYSSVHTSKKYRHSKHRGGADSPTIGQTYTFTLPAGSDTYSTVPDIGSYTYNYKNGDDDVVMIADSGTDIGDDTTQEFVFQGPTMESPKQYLGNTNQINMMKVRENNPQSLLSQKIKIADVDYVVSAVSKSGLGGMTGRTVFALTTDSRNPGVSQNVYLMKKSLPHRTDEKACTCDDAANLLASIAPPTAEI